MAKYDKKRQGLVKDVSLSTDFDKSVLYEAFTHVYRDTVTIQSAQSSEVVEPLHIEILRGTMSGNIVLRVTFINQDNKVKELCLFAEEQARSHKICSEIVHVSPRARGDAGAAEGQQDSQMEAGPQPLAYVLSLEKLYGHEQILVVRLVLIEKWDQNVMMDYSWAPEGRPQEGSTQFNSETLYLVKKSDTRYCRVTEYEILNTEMRTLLFMHAYGYTQANADFGNIRRYLEQGEQRRVSHLSVLGSDEYLKEAMNVNIKEPAAISDYKGMNQLLYRQYCVVRVRRLLQEGADEASKAALAAVPGEESEMGRSSRQALGFDQAARQASDARRNELERALPDGAPSNYDALVAVLVDGQCLDRGEVIVKVVI